MQSLTYLFEHHDGVYWCVDRASDTRTLLGRDEKIATRKFQEIVSPVATVGTVEALLNWYLAEVAPKKKPRTYKQNQTEANFLLKDVALTSLQMRELRPYHIVGYRDKRGLEAQTRANRELGLLSAAFSKAVERGWVDLNPCFGVKKFPERKRDRYISDAEFQTVYRACPKYIQRLLILMYTTAQRPADVIQLGRRNLMEIQSKGKRIQVLRLRQNKTDAPVDIVVSGRLKLLVEECQNDPPHVETFVYTARTTTTINYEKMRKRFTKIVERCGIKNFHIYDIRAKAATDMYSNGIPLEKIQVLLGHTSVKTTEIYIKARSFALAEPNEIDPLRGFR